MPGGVQVHLSRSTVGVDRADDLVYVYELLASLREGWRSQAACRGVAADGGTNMFFPDRGEDHRPAIALCRRCPVIDACRAHAETQPELHGIWHGQGQRARARGRRTGRPPGKAAA